MVFERVWRNAYSWQILDLRSMVWSSRFNLGVFTINYCKFYQMLEVITDRDGKEGVADGFFLVVLRGLNWVTAWMESYNPFASVVDPATSGRDALRAEWQVRSDDNKFSVVSKRMVIFWINDSYLGTSSEHSHKMMGNVRLHTSFPLFACRI